MKLKLTTWVVISIFLLLPLVFTGCAKREDIKQTQTPQENESNQFYENEKVTVRVQTPSGEKSYDGILVRWWSQGVTIKTDNDRTLLAIASQTYTVEKQIPR